MTSTMITSVVVNGLTFDASFDSGNAVRVEAGAGPDEFHLQIMMWCLVATYPIFFLGLAYGALFL